MLVIANTIDSHFIDTGCSKPASKFDYTCSLMFVQVNMLRERNKSYGAIKFVDISSNDYSPDDNQGLDYETVRITQDL